MKNFHQSFVLTVTVLVFILFIVPAASAEQNATQKLNASMPDSTPGLVGADGQLIVTEPPITQEKYVPTQWDETVIWVNSRLGKRTVKPYHMAVHKNGVQCSLCHAAENPVSPPDDRNCLRCHGTVEQVAALTKDLAVNPHDSLHYGTNMPCTTCHHEHKESEIYCNHCHQYVFENFKK